ncbi:hypothetical protein EV182_001996 [Spiromyces aspiralis]|uniref:Uncharacterized protein n=1 Tax=Spiromyces aspiralis TaxID=68401 RepID=A0ACC1HI80_9FUNG|nr:hypothetical protein EV182_001996 [Spiromyces aspiralis]
MPFMGGPLNFVLVYIWSRQNPYTIINFMGLFSCTAPYFPLVMLGFSAVMSGRIPVEDLVGIMVGHVLWFFEDEWPRRSESGGVRVLRAPGVLRELMGQGRDLDDQGLLDTDDEEEEGSSGDAEGSGASPRGEGSQGAGSSHSREARPDDDEGSDSGSPRTHGEKARLDLNQSEPILRKHPGCEGNDGEGHTPSSKGSTASINLMSPSQGVTTVRRRDPYQPDE